MKTTKTAAARMITNAIESKRQDVVNAVRAQEFIAAESGNLSELLQLISGKHISHVAVYGGRPTTIDVSMTDLSSLKRGPVPQLIEKLTDWASDHGFYPKWDSTMYPAYANCDYKLSIERGGQDYFTVRISAYVKTDSKQCRKVQVGEQTTTKPIYEMRCT